MDVHRCLDVPLLAAEEPVIIKRYVHTCFSKLNLNIVISHEIHEWTQIKSLAGELATLDDRVTSTERTRNQRHFMASMVQGFSVDGGVICRHSAITILGNTLGLPGTRESLNSIS